MWNGIIYVYGVIRRPSQTTSQIQNWSWNASRVWHLMCVICLTTLLMLTGQCRGTILTNLYPMFNSWMNILGLARKGPSRTDHRRNLSSTESLTTSRRDAMLAKSRWPISIILLLVIGNNFGGDVMG